MTKFTKDEIDLLVRASKSCGMNVPEIVREGALFRARDILKTVEAPVEVEAAKPQETKDCASCNGHFEGSYDSARCSNCREDLRKGKGKTKHFGVFPQSFYDIKYR